MLARETAKGHRKTIWTAQEAPQLSSRREAPGRQARIIWTAWEAPGKQETTNWTACEATWEAGKDQLDSLGGTGRLERAIWTAWEAGKAPGR